MKKIITGVLAIALIFTFSAFALASNGEKTATPSQTKFIMDGREITFDSAYNIEDSNYLQLRSVAQALNGTKSQFNVYWDNALRQAVIETGKPYTGVPPTDEPPSATPQSYKIGDTIMLKNATICVTAVTTADRTPPDEYGSTFGASKDHTFLCISFEVTANNLSYNNTLWHSTQFITYATAASGINYQSPFMQGTAGFGENTKETATVYIEIPANETITSIVVSDGAGETATVSVQ